MVQIMWFLRGAQSAVFYYVACTPCTDVKYRRKRRKEAEQSRADRARLEQEQPHFIQQPLPGYTNDYWAEEIARGPGPPVKRGHGPRDPIGSRTGSRKGTFSSGQGSSHGQRPTTNEGGHEISPPDPARGAKRVDSSSQQREDEELWGKDPNFNRSGRAGRPSHRREGSSIGLPGRGRADTDTSSGYYVSHTTVINEINAPIIYTLPTRKSETRWMLQPPPRAKVMEGKESGPPYANRSRGSTMRQEENDPRVWAGKSSETQNMSGENYQLANAPGRTSEERDFATSSNTGQRHDRDPTFRKRKLPPPAISITKDPPASQFSQDLSPDQFSPRSSSMGSLSATVPRRPPLATIKSTSDIVPQLRSLQELELALAASSPLTSDSTLNSRSPSPFSTKFSREQDHPDADFPQATPRKDRPDDVYYWAGNEFKLSTPGLRRNDENETMHRRYDSVGGASRIWRWSMDI